MCNGVVPGSDEAAVERRESVRHLAVMRVATLHTARGEELCLVRNISTGGFKARIWSDLAVGDVLTTEFKSGCQVPGKVIWQRDDHVGVQFDAAEDITAILVGDEDPAPGIQPRAPRVHVEVPGRIRIDARYFQVMLCNISQSGAKVRLTLPDALEEREPPVILSLAGLPSLAGTLRWHDREAAGIAFNTPIALDTLAHWVGMRHG